MEAQFHLVAFVHGDRVFAVVVITIATGFRKIAVLGIQVVRQRAAELVAILRAHTCTTRYEHAPHARGQDLVAVT
jgi:hypothetical protein